MNALLSSSLLPTTCQQLLVLQVTQGSLFLMSTAICFIPKVSCWQAHNLLYTWQQAVSSKTLSMFDSKHQMGLAYIPRDVSRGEGSFALAANSSFFHRAQHC